MLKCHAANAVALHLHGKRAHVQPYLQKPGRPIRRQHLFKHMQACARLKPQRTDPAGSRVHMGIPHRMGGEGIIPPVIIADTRPEFPVTGRRSILFNPRVFVKRDSLGRCLATNPARFLRHDHPAPGLARRKRSRYPAEAAAGNEDLGVIRPVHPIYSFPCPVC